MHWWTLWKVLGEEVKVSRLFPIITTRDIHKDVLSLGGRRGLAGMRKNVDRGREGV